MASSRLASLSILCACYLALVLADSTVNSTEQAQNATDETTDESSTLSDQSQSRGTGKAIVDYITYKIYHYSWLYVGPVLIFGGTISNTLAFIVLRSHLFSGTGTTFLLSTLAAVDTMVLLVNVMRHWIIHLTDYETDVRSFGIVGCKIHIFLTYVGPQWSGWILVLVTAERVVSVWFPLQAKTYCTRKRIIFVWIVLMTLVAATDVPLLIKYEIVDQSCSVTPDNLHYRNVILYWTDFVMFNAAPSILIFLLNILIIVKLMRPQINRQNDKKAQKAITSVTVMLVTVSIIYLITTTPVSIYFLGYKTIFPDYETDINQYLSVLAMYSLTNLGAYINNSCNFLLYFISGERFRRAFMDMFCPCFVKRRLHTGVSKTNSSMVEGTSVTRGSVSQQDSTKI